MSSCAFLAPALSPPPNPDDSYEGIGFGTDGSMTIITAAAGAHAKGSYATIGTTANAWAGFWLEIGDSNGSTRRYLVDVRAGGATVIVPDLFIVPTITGSGRAWLPIAVAAGTLIEARCQCDTGSSTIRLAASGRIRSSNSPPCFSSAVSITTVDNAGTTVGLTSVPLQSSLGTYTELVTSTAATYGALMATVDRSGTPATSQEATTIIAVGAAASEVPIGRISAHINTSAPFVIRANRTFEKSVLLGSRLSAATLAATPGSDNMRVQLHGFV